MRFSRLPPDEHNLQLAEFDSVSSPKSPDRTEQSQAERRKARLAEQLRANLQRRKAQTRSRRAGEADERDHGLPVAGDIDDTAKD